MPGGAVQVQPETGGFGTVSVGETHRPGVCIKGADMAVFFFSVLDAAQMEDHLQAPDLCRSQFAEQGVSLVFCILIPG